MIAAGSYDGLIIAVLPEDETTSVGPRDARNDAHHRVCLLILDDSNSRQRVAEPRSGSPSLVRSRPLAAMGFWGRLHPPSPALRYSLSQAPVLLDRGFYTSNA